MFFLVMFVAYLFQIRHAVIEAGRTDYMKSFTLAEFVHGKQRATARHWPFFAITILFPVLISTLPIIFAPSRFQVLEGGIQVVNLDNVFVFATTFAMNFLIVLITIEFSILYGLKNLPHHWITVLLVATTLDVVMFLFISYMRFFVEFSAQDQVIYSWYTFAFVLNGCIFALLASAYVIISVRLLNENK